MKFLSAGFIGECYWFAELYVDFYYFHCLLKSLFVQCDVITTKYQLQKQ